MCTFLWTYNKYCKPNKTISQKSNLWPLKVDKHNDDLAVLRKLPEHLKFVLRVAEEKESLQQWDQKGRFHPLWTKNTHCTLEFRTFLWINNSIMDSKWAVIVVAVVGISSPCHQEFWVHHKVELLPWELATGRRTPTQTHRKKKKRDLEQDSSADTTVSVVSLFRCTYSKTLMQPTTPFCLKMLMPAAS